MTEAAVLQITYNNETLMTEAAVLQITYNNETLMTSCCVTDHFVVLNLDEITNP